MVKREDGFAPLLSAKTRRDGLLAIEHGPIAVDGYAARFEYARQHLVAAALFLHVLAKQMCPREVLVLGKHPPPRHQLVQSGAGKHEAAPAVRKDGLLPGPNGGAEVVGRLGVEVDQEAVHVVPIDVRVQLNEDEPVRLGAQVSCEFHHGEELVFVQAPALARLLIAVVRPLDRIVDVEVLIVVPVFWAEVREDVVDLQAIVLRFAVREEQEVLLATSKAGQIGWQLHRNLAGTHFEHNRDIVHYARLEGGAFLAVGYVGSLSGGRSGVRVGVLEQFVAARAVQQVCNE